jgi:GTPase SAR1 family protein
LNSNTRPPNNKPTSESRKPTLKPVYGPDQSGPSKNVLIAIFGMTGTGKTSLIKSLAGARADKLQTGHGLESCKCS